MTEGELRTGGDVIASLVGDDIASSVGDNWGEELVGEDGCEDGVASTALSLGAGVSWLGEIGLGVSCVAGLGVVVCGCSQLELKALRAIPVPAKIAIAAKPSNQGC